MTKIDAKLARQWAKKWTLPQLQTKLDGLSHNAKNAPTAKQRELFAGMVATCQEAVRLSSVKH